MNAAQLTAGDQQRCHAVYWLGAVSHETRSLEYLDHMRFKAHTSAPQRLALRDACIALAAQVRNNVVYVRDLGALLHVGAPRLAFRETDTYDYEVIVQPADLAQSRAECAA